MRKIHFNQMRIEKISLTSPIDKQTPAILASLSTTQMSRNSTESNVQVISCARNL